MFYFDKKEVEIRVNALDGLIGKIKKLVNKKFTKNLKTPEKWHEVRSFSSLDLIGKMDFLSSSISYDNKKEQNDEKEEKYDNNDTEDDDKKIYQDPYLFLRAYVLIFPTLDFKRSKSAKKESYKLNSKTFEIIEILEDGETLFEKFKDLLEKIKIIGKYGKAHMTILHI